MLSVGNYLGDVLASDWCTAAAGESKVFPDGETRTRSDGLALVVSRFKCCGANGKDKCAAADTAGVVALEISATAVLEGVTKVQFEANKENFKSGVAVLHTGKTAADVLVDAVTETSTRRRLLATQLSVDYRITGFSSQAAADQ
eukprot:854465-Rhodomonas_salina.1